MVWLSWLGKIFSSRLFWVATAIAAGVYWAHLIEEEAYQSGVSDERVAQSMAMFRAINDAKRAHEQQLRARGWQDKREADMARLHNADLQRRLTELAALPPKTLIQTKVVRDETGCEHPDPSLGDAFWVRYRAAGDLGEPADIGSSSAVRYRMR